MRALAAVDLAQAKAGSYYTIRGAGGPLGEYVTAVETFLEEQGVGKPQEWFTSTGREVNKFARSDRGGPIRQEDMFKPDLTFLMFPLDGLNVGILALVRLRMEDIWFDDMIQGMRVDRG